VPTGTRTQRAFPSGWLVSSANDLRVLGPRLEAEILVRLPAPSVGVHAVSHDREFIVIALTDRICRLSRQEEIIWEARHPRRAHGAAGACWIPVDDAVAWATVPDEAGAESWHVLDAKDGRLIDVCPLGPTAASADLTRHPDGRRVGLTLEEGDSATRVWWGGWQSGCATAQQIGEATGRRMVDIRPSGHQFLTLATDKADVAVHDVADGRATAEQHPPPSWGEDISFDALAGYVTDDIVLAGSLAMESQLVLQADDLRFTDLLDYPDATPHGPIRTAGDGTWLTQDEGSGAEALLQLWRTH